MKCFKHILVYKALNFIFFWGHGNTCATGMLLARKLLNIYMSMCLDQTIRHPNISLSLSLSKKKLEVLIRHVWVKRPQLKHAVHSELDKPS